MTQEQPPSERTESSRWFPPETAPKDGTAFLFTAAGPNVDLCLWVEGRQQFEDYFFNQRILQEWPFMIGWQPLPQPAIICDTEEETRQANGWPNSNITR